MDHYWAAINGQLAELRKATTADEVIAALGGPAEGADAFFGGSGGDESMAEALADAGWRTVWAEADYYYVMRAPGGDKITYVEGDVFRGDTAIKGR